MLPDIGVVPFPSLCSLTLSLFKLYCPNDSLLQSRGSINSRAVLLNQHYCLASRSTGHIYLSLPCTTSLCSAVSTYKPKWPGAMLLHLDARIFWLPRQWLSVVHTPVKCSVLYNACYLVSVSSLRGGTWTYVLPWSSSVCFNVFFNETFWPICFAISIKREKSGWTGPQWDVKPPHFFTLKELGTKSLLPFKHAVPWLRLYAFLKASICCKKQIRSFFGNVLECTLLKQCSGDVSRAIPATPFFMGKMSGEKHSAIREFVCTECNCTQLIQLFQRVWALPLC